MNESCHPTSPTAQTPPLVYTRNTPPSTHSKLTIAAMCRALPSIFRTGTLQGKPSTTLDDLESIQ